MATERFIGYRKILAISAFMVCLTACGNNAPAETGIPTLSSVETMEEETTVGEEANESMTDEEASEMPAENAADTDEEQTRETTETEISSVTEETTETEETYPEQTEETTETITEPQVSDTVEMTTENDTANEACEDMAEYLLLTPKDIFLKFGDNYTMEVVNSAGICFDGMPLVFWVDYDWNTESVISDGRIYSIEALKGGSLKYNIKVGETSIDEFSTLTNGKYSSEDAEIDEDMTGDLMLIMKENGFTTYYRFDDNGIVKYAMVKISD